MSATQSSNRVALNEFKSLIAQLTPDQRKDFDAVFIILNRTMNEYGPLGVLAVGLIGVTLSLEQEGIDVDEGSDHNGGAAVNGSEGGSAADSGN